MYGISNAQKTFSLKNGTVSTFQEWIETITYDGRNFIESCELGRNNSLHIVYETKFEAVMTKIFGSNIKDMAASFSNKDENWPTAISPP